MQEIYLTKELKQYYLKDFLDNVVDSSNASWQLDDKTIEPLKRINASPNIQTLYSKRFVGQLNSLPESYLKFCYRQENEKSLFRCSIPLLIQEFNNLYNNSYLYYSFQLPGGNPNYDKESKPLGMGCTDDKDYFMVNSIKVYFESNETKLHDLFWDKITEELSNY